MVLVLAVKVASFSDDCAAILHAPLEDLVTSSASLLGDPVFSVLGAMRSEPLLLKLPVSFRMANNRSLSLFKFAVADMGVCSVFLESFTFPLPSHFDTLVVGDGGALSSSCLVNAASDI